MKKKKYLAIFMAMSMATATAPVTALADDATTGTESGAETGESGSGETGSTGETGSENGGTEGGSTTAPDTPAENEGVKTTEVSVSVIPGAVVVKGAEGKTVAISNVLGQTIANTVITSSEATISVPAGIVFVAVEGESAVKAIIK